MAFRSVLLSTLAAHTSAVWLGGVNIAGCEIGIDTSVSTYSQASNYCKKPSSDRIIGQLGTQRVREPVWLSITRHGEESNAALYRR